MSAAIDPRASWQDDPRAVALLASCARNPPRMIEREQFYGLTTDRWHEYRGRRVDQLEAIRGEYGSAALELSDTGDGDPFDRWSAGPDVTDAIDAATGCTHRDRVHGWGAAPLGAMCRSLAS